jgi:hypothetical protein
MRLKNKKTWYYSVTHHGEISAGIIPFSDTIRIIVESGDPGGGDNEFAEFMAYALREWYYGAIVEAPQECDCEYQYEEIAKFSMSCPVHNGRKPSRP